MEDLSSFIESPKQELRQALQASKDASPFLYSLAARTAKGAAVGLVVSSIFFRSKSFRVSGLYYGAGFGLGMSYSQVHALWGALNGAATKSDE